MDREKITYKNGDVYEGDVVNGNPHGNGKLTIVLKDILYNQTIIVYEGDFDNGKYHGYGKLTSDFGNSGKTIYEGSFNNDEYHGKGKIEYNNGTIYEGDFANGQFHGIGKLIEAIHKFTYEGEFLNGKRHGIGKQINDDSTFEGEFVNDLRHKGKCTYADGKVEDGYWKGYVFYGDEIPPEDKKYEPISEEEANFLFLRGGS